MNMTEYRLYPDGTVYHEDDYKNDGWIDGHSDDYESVLIPDEIISYIIDTSVSLCADCHQSQKV